MSKTKKYILIKRKATPESDNTVGMYKRDGKGAYTTDEDLGEGSRGWKEFGNDEGYRKDGSNPVDDRIAARSRERRRRAQAQAAAKPKKPSGPTTKTEEIEEASPYRNPNKDGMISKTSEKSAARAAKARRKIRIKLAQRRAEKKSKEENIEENLAYLKDKTGNTFVVSKRNTKGMRGTQDKFSMSVVDKRGKTVKDYGSHPSLQGAKKFGASRGFSEEAGRAMEEVEVDEDVSSVLGPAAVAAGSAAAHYAAGKAGVALSRRKARKGKLGIDAQIHRAGEDYKDKIKRDARIRKAKSAVTGAASKVKSAFTRKEEVEIDELTQAELDQAKKEGKFTKLPTRGKPRTSRTVKVRSGRPSGKKLSDRAHDKASRAMGEEVDGVDEAVSLDGRTRDYRGARTRLEAKGRRNGVGIDGRLKIYREAVKRIAARHKLPIVDDSEKKSKGGKPKTKDTSDTFVTSGGKREPKRGKMSTDSDNVSSLIGQGR